VQDEKAKIEIKNVTLKRNAEESAAKIADAASQIYKDRENDKLNIVGYGILGGKQKEIEFMVRNNQVMQNGGGGIQLQ
jgi:hypothetical protein